MTLLRQEGWTRWPTEVPSNPYYSVIFCDILRLHPLAASQAKPPGAQPRSTFRADIPAGSSKTSSGLEAAEDDPNPGTARARHGCTTYSTALGCSCLEHAGARPNPPADLSIWSLSLVFQPQSKNNFLTPVTTKLCWRMNTPVTRWGTEGEGPELLFYLETGDLQTCSKNPVSICKRPKIAVAVLRFQQPDFHLWPTHLQYSELRPKSRVNTYFVLDANAPLQPWDTLLHVRLVPPGISTMLCYKRCSFPLATLQLNCCRELDHSNWFFCLHPSAITQKNLS